jgi:hypothetical protein
LFYGKYNRKLVKDTIPLISSVDRDEFIMASETAFDCTFDFKILSLENAN